ncbi:MAG: adenylate/guanylate cyclase domain-containing protein [Candidatus Tectimicrobiota bacterium]
MSRATTAIYDMHRSLRGAKILVVDDLPQNIQVVGSILRSNGFQVMVATSGAQALRALTHDRPDLILLDLFMPEMNGVEVCQRLKSNPATHDLPVIFLTASSELEHLELAFEAGAVDYVLKPFKTTELLARVRAHIELKQSRDVIIHLRDQTEHLLLNILPAPIAERLKDGERVVDDFAEVTVCFMDIVSFTQTAASMRPGEVVAYLDTVFATIDQIVEAYDLEKIKTIGDAYMVASGLPRPHPDHAARMADMALDVQASIGALGGCQGREVHLRIGMHSGPVMAGIIGARKFLYDLWGDTVNTASRMESSGAADKIHLSAATHAALGTRYTFETRSPLNIKGKGLMQTYFLSGRAL